MRKFHTFLLFLLFLIGCQAQDITNEGADRQALLVEVEQVSEQNIQKNIELQGTALPKNQVPLLTPTPLKVEKVYKTVGQAVEKNEVIISLNNETARRQVDQARKVVTELESALQKANQLNQTNVQNVGELENLEQELRSSLERTEELIANRGDIELEEFIRELLASTITISTKQTELTQAVQNIQNSPVNTFELEMQIANARENLRQMELALDATQLKAPFAGIIGQMDVTVGQTALPNSPLATVIVLDPVVATFSANSFQISLLQEGQQASITIDGIPEPIESKISTVSPTINPQTNTFTVKMDLNNPQNKIKGGMRTKALIDLGVVDMAKVIPIDSILYEDNVPYVFTIIDNQTAKRQPISVGVRDGEFIEVLEGLNMGDTVITTGKERVTDGAKISIRNE